MSSAQARDPDDIVRHARALEGEARSAFVAAMCGSDLALRARVERELAASEGLPEDFLEPPTPSRQGAQGHRLGDFEILRELGRGGMGVVYLALQTTLDREVAVKVFVGSLTTTEREVERFHREARAAAKLHHPGIVQVYADGQEGETHWFAMEFVEGHDLRRELELQREPGRAQGESAILPGPEDEAHLSTAARVCADVAEALDHAHDHGLVHRDIKPNNLLLQPGGRVQVADFGLVRDESEGSLTRSGEMAGSPHYMSPEQARLRDVQVDHRTDVYSLGVVLYEMLTLRRPFTGRTTADIFARIRDGHPRSLRSINPRVPRDLELICAKAMAHDLRERYASAGDLARDLRRFLRHEAIEAKPPTVHARALRWARRHRVHLGAAALGAVSLGVGFWIRDTSAYEGSLAKLDLRALDRAGAPLEGAWSVAEIDPITGVLGDFEEVDERLRRAPGYVRLRLELEQGGTRSFTRTLELGRNPDLEARVDPAPVDTEGMVLIEGGRLLVDDSSWAPAVAATVQITGVEIDVESFWLDRTEVSNAQYRAFLLATGRREPEGWADVLVGEHDDLPVVKVSWEDARAYAEWRGKRLPSYPEWTWAARGAEGRVYPWQGAELGTLRGNTREPWQAVHDSARGPIYLASAAPVDSHPDARTPSGLHHMFGNVAEWTESPIAERIGETFEPRPALRIVAGHAWNAGEKKQSLATYAIAGTERSWTDHSYGFRCALDVQP